MAGIRTCDRESQVQRPNHYTTEPPCDVIGGSTCTRVLKFGNFYSASKSGICGSPYMREYAVVFISVQYRLHILLVILYNVHVLCIVFLYNVHVLCL